MTQRIRLAVLVLLALQVGCGGSAGPTGGSSAGATSSSSGAAGASGGGSSSGRGSSTGGGGADAGVDVCAQMCAHVYVDCGMAFRAQSGAAVPQAQCVTGCQAGDLNGAESCLLTAACTGPALNACLTGEATGSSSSSGGGGASSSSGGTGPAGWLPEETRVLELVNQRRAAGATCGGQSYAAAPAMTADEALQRSARAHAVDMAQNNYFSHTSQDGRTFSQRIFAAGYSGSAPLAENIAAGNGTAESTVAQWMNSTGHCQNIMNPSLRRLGVGHGQDANSQYGDYWVQNFGGQ